MPTGIVAGIDNLPFFIAFFILYHLNVAHFLLLNTSTMLIGFSAGYYENQPYFYVVTGLIAEELLVLLFACNTV